MIDLKLLKNNLKDIEKKINSRGESFDLNTIVLDYEKNNYLFMVADPSNKGYHLFASNLSEHNKNRRAYIRWINSKGIYR